MAKNIAYTSLMLALSLLLACSDSGSGSGSQDKPEPDAGEPVTSAALRSPPTKGLFDEKYFDGHLVKGQATPILPPGRWDWKAEDNDLATWRTFQKNIGSFRLLRNDQAQPYGWELVGNKPSAIEYTGSAPYFEGSSGNDIINLGPQGSMHSFEGQLGGGDDVLVFNRSWALDFSTSGDLDGSVSDNDLIVAGCDTNQNSSFDIQTTSIHAGSGADVFFVRDAERSGFDAGNRGGATNQLDPQDGDDVAVFRGNMLDFRFYGGAGNDTAVWYVDEVNQNSAWLGPNFFGAGGAGEAIWGDTGTDRLVLGIPLDTTMIHQGPTGPGQLLITVIKDYKSEIQWDKPTLGDSKANYCITCGIGPKGRKTLTLEYRSANGSIRTGYFWVTAFEELQIGLGPDAKVYQFNETNGEATLNPDLKPFLPPQLDSKYCR